MTKKISPNELEQIIVEEIEKTLVDEGFGDFVSRVTGAGKAAMSGALEKGKEKWKQIGQQQADEKKVSALMGLIGDYIQANRTDPQVMKAIKDTEIVKKLGLAEALPSSYEAELRAKNVTKQDVDQFLQAVSDIPSAQKFFKGYLPQAQQPQVTEPKAPQAQAQQAQQAPRAQAASAVDMGDIVAQGRSEQEPKFDRRTPERDKFIKPEQKDAYNMYSGYMTLGNNLKLNWDTQVKPMFDYLVSKGLLYKMGSIREQENPIKIWQDHGINTEEKLRTHPFFMPLVNDIHAKTKVSKNAAIIPFLVAIWKQGKLVKPKSRLDGPEYTKADIQQIVKQPDYTDDQGEEIYFEESNRWQKLAGIVKD